MWWITELLSSTRFLAIQGDRGFWHSKRVYEVALPLAFASAMLVLYVWNPCLFNAKALQTAPDKLFQFMIFVVPFHLAALAAFSTFNRPVLDQQLKGTSAQLRHWSNSDNEYQYKHLSLRQYVSLLFGYLCTIGILFIVIYIVFSVFSLDIGSDLTSRSASMFMLMFFIAHYSLMSIYAITFLFAKVNEI
ncbi:hypothetical protein [Terrihabitans rhizophilus]|uniref:Uncharacterized protein n=1 Tax=Terrihabitans rhizophilus TaxID=3092662 RepID=A0ABU4RJP7_9HYPH|nr:hypothetical protein [Terrihabitans sp. PJ23]MDX6805067.1 hypothetical protein [Terrihabitans sp. PJ23]